MSLGPVGPKKDPNLNPRRRLPKDIGKTSPKLGGLVSRVNRPLLGTDLARC